VNVLASGLGATATEPPPDVCFPGDVLIEISSVWTSLSLGALPLLRASDRHWSFAGRAQRKAENVLHETFLRAWR
jgi:hypothetical protein